MDHLVQDVSPRACKGDHDDLMAGGSCRVGLVSRQSEASAFALRALNIASGRNGVSEEVAELVTSALVQFCPAFFTRRTQK